MVVPRFSDMDEPSVAGTRSVCPSLFAQKRKEVDEAQMVAGYEVGSFGFIDEEPVDGI